MEKPVSSVAEPELKEVVWNQMIRTEDAEVRLATEAWIEEMYRVGAVDAKRFRFPQWKAAFQTLPKEEDGFRVTVEQFKRLTSFLFPAKVKKPFEPQRLKDGARPVAWLSELYQKVLRFETTLPLETWKKMIQDQIQPKLVRGDQVTLNAAFKQWLAALLQKNASPLRKLELWYLEKTQAPQKSLPAQTAKTPSKPIVVKDAYETKPHELASKAAIDQLYYHHEQHPALDDKESLDFLDQLAELEEEDSDKIE